MTARQAVGESTHVLEQAERTALLERALRLYRLDPGLALHRCAEASLVQRRAPLAPLLEIGCHDGTFAGLALDGLVSVSDRTGCDLDPEGLTLARPRYGGVLAADCARLPWRDGMFESALCNSVLAHVEDLPACVEELHRILRTGGRLFASVPTPRFHAWFAPARLLRAAGLRGAADALQRRYDRNWQQRNFLDRAEWERLLASAGLRMESWTEYFDASSSWVWSSWFTGWRLGLGRVTIGAIARRLLPADADRTRAVEHWLARRLAHHAAPAIGAGGSAMFCAVRDD